MRAIEFVDVMMRRLDTLGGQSDPQGRLAVFIKEDLDVLKTLMAAEQGQGRVKSAEEVLRDAGVFRPLPIVKQGEPDTVNESELRPGDIWIHWDGGPCPVPIETGVEVKLRNGYLSEYAAAGFRWDHRPDYHSRHDIVAYRIKKEAAK